MPPGTFPVRESSHVQAGQDMSRYGIDATGQDGPESLDHVQTYSGFVAPA